MRLNCNAARSSRRQRREYGARSHAQNDRERELRQSQVKKIFVFD
jgi:hypothetical protein